MAQKSKTARVIKRSAEMIHSDSELAQKMEPAVAPEAGPSNTELVENSHAENGASPVIDGDLKSPERANVNAMREALETQAEMEVGKPIAEKQEEIKAEEAGKTMEIDAQPGKQIIINIASWDYPSKKAAFLNPKTARFLTIDEVKKAGREYLNMIRTAAVEVAQGEDAQGFHMLIKMNGREYALYGTDADDFRREYAAIPKPQDKVNALIEKYMWKMQPYGLRQKPRPAAPAPAKAPEQQPNIPAYLKQKEQEENTKGTKQNPDIPSYLKRKEMEEGYTRYGMPQTNYASVQKTAYVAHVPGHRNSKGESAPWVIKQHNTDKILESFKSEEAAKEGLKNMESHKHGAQKTADYEGWSNWATWHVNLLIDNTESSYNTKRRLCQNALRKGIQIDQLASQFSRMFRKQYKETKEFYEANAADARDSRGKWEGRQLEGLKPDAEGDRQQYLKDVVEDLFYGIGGQSGWEEPFEEVNWREIAQHALENEREEGSVPEQKQKAPEFSQEDKDFLAEMKIKGSKDMDKNKKKANPMDTAVEPMAPVTIPSAPETPEIEEPREIDDPVLVSEVAEELFPGFDFAELAASQQRDVIAVARERKKEMAHAAAQKKAGEGMAKNVKEVEKEAGFNFFFPGQVTKEFYPELMHEIVDFPNANNTPMGVETPEIVGDGGDQAALEQMLDQVMNGMGAIESIQLPSDVGEIEEVQFDGANTASEKTADVSTSPAGGMGIGRDGKSQVLEGVPLRKENDIRGPMFTDEFYGQYQGISGESLGAMASLKAKRAADETDVDQFTMFLKKVVGEIAATFLAAFKVTSRPLLDKVPGVGEVQLQYVEQPQGMSAFNTVNTGSRVKYLMDKLNDSEIQDAINDAWAQAAVWHDGPKGGYVYEVFVRAESIDTDSMIMKYKFVAGTRE